MTILGDVWDDATGLFKNGLGGAGSKILGSENKFRAQAPQVNPNAYQYGGQPGGADEAANRYRQQAEAAQGRQGVNVDYNQANQDRALQMQARQGQGVVAQSALARALGQTPSIAQMQGDRQMGQATAAQASMAASARGAGALANAQRNAANNVANTQANISGQAQINAANERQQAEQNAAGMFANMRSGDTAAQGQDAGQAATQAGFSDAQRGRNDAMTNNMTGAEMGVRSAQLTGSMNQQAQQSANAMGAQNINAGISGQNAAMNQQNGGAVLGAIQGGLGALAGALARGGPMDAGRKPYLVGENGPELVVPQKDGYVIPAPQTREMLRSTPASFVNAMFRRGDQAAPGHSLSSILGNGRACGGYMPARADGGPVDAGGAPTNGYAPSTWGVGPGTPIQDPGAAQWAAEMNSGLNAAGDRELDQRLGYTGANMQGLPGYSPGLPFRADDPLVRRDLDISSSARAREAQGIEPSEREAYEVQGADYRLRNQRKTDRTKSAEDKSKKSEDDKRSTLSKVLGGVQEGAKGAPSLDVSYHGPSGYAAPALLALPARAMGGPVEAGGSSMGSLIGSLFGRSQGASSGPAAPSFEVIGPNSGEDVLGSEKAMSNVATQYGRQGGASPMSFGGAREEGGTVQPAKAYVVGEKGPEVVVPDPRADARELATMRAGANGSVTQSRADDARTDANRMVRDAPLWAVASPALGLGAASGAVMSNGEAVGHDAMSVAHGGLPPPPLEPEKRDERRATTANRVASFVAPIAPAAAIGADVAGILSALFAARKKDGRVEAREEGGPIRGAGEQAAQDAERAAMNAAERVVSAPTPVHSTDNTVLRLTDPEVFRRIHGGDGVPWRSRLASVLGNFSRAPR